MDITSYITDAVDPFSNNPVNTQYLITIHYIFNIISFAALVIFLKKKPETP